MTFQTADLFDEHGEKLQVMLPGLSSFGGRSSFSGKVATVKVFEDNSLVKQKLSTPGEGRVLVVDGAGSLRCALLGDQLAALGVKNGWSGVVINGCIRDAKLIKGMDLGVLARATTPRKTIKRDSGLADVPVDFLGVGFSPGAHLYADEDGVLVADSGLL